MNNKGFAITGIIYTLFILFLMILLTVLTGLSSYQRLMINSTRSLENSFEGEKIVDDPSTNNDKFDNIKNNGYAKYLGKYVFELANGIECSTYLKKGTYFKEYKNAESFSKNVAKLSPYDCNHYNKNMELIKVYSFEGDKYEED